MMFKRYLIFALLIGLMQACAFNKSFYYTKSEYVERIDIDSKEVNLKNEAGVKLNGILLTPKIESPKGYILLVHGNGGNISGWIDLAVPLQKNGYEVLVFDWQGYGRSEGKPTHNNVVTDTELFLNYLNDRNSRKKVILWGQSLGANLSVNIAYRNPEKVHSMIIEAGFTNHNAIAVHMMPLFIKPAAKVLVKSPFQSDKLIKELNMPLLIVHSNEDEVVPFWMGEMLYANANQPKELWKIAGKHCKGMFLYEKEYLKKINKLAKINKD